MRRATAVALGARGSLKPVVFSQISLRTASQRGMAMRRTQQFGRLDRLYGLVAGRNAHPAQAVDDVLEGLFGCAPREALRGRREYSMRPTVMRNVWQWRGRRAG